MTARDVAGDLFHFVRKLHHVASVHAAVDGKSLSPIGEAAAHDFIMKVLLAPRELASWQTRLIVQHPRTRHKSPLKARFGAEQVTGTPPADWLPVTLTTGQPIEYGIAQRRYAPSKGWLVTVRDPAPEICGARLEQSQWLWDCGWENIIRWPPSPFRLDSGDELTVPVTAKNTLLNVPGLFHVFMLIEPEHSSRMEEILEVEDTDHVPDQEHYFRLIDNLTTLTEKGGIEVFAGSYIVD